MLLRDQSILRFEILPRLHDAFLYPEPVRQSPHDRLAGVRIISRQCPNLHS